MSVMMSTDPAMERQTERKTSIWSARAVPVFLMGVVAYVSYVITGPLSVSFIAKDDRYGLRTAIAIPLVWFILLFPVTVSWMRLLYVVILAPGYIPQREPVTEDTIFTETPGLETFYNRDIFVCDAAGLPIWCRQCNNWKTDRAHHNQDVARCTSKMDHFCPWVGGVVGERSYKFFLQFLIYSVLLCIYGMTVFAFFVHLDHTRAHWDVALGLTAFFLLFTFGMVVNSLWMVGRNVTTIENINMGGNSRVIYLAVKLPERDSNQSDTSQPNSSDGQSTAPNTKEGPRPSREVPSSPPLPVEKLRTITYPLQPLCDRPPLPAPIGRTFAVVRLPAGMNPWDLGSPWLNFKEVFGHKWYDWFLPFRYSPCCNHDSAISEYALSPRLEQYLDDLSHLEQAEMEYSGVKRKKRRHRQRTLDKGWKNGERPNGWTTYREMRRAEKDRAV